MWALVDRIVAHATSIGMVVALVWIGVALIFISLIVLMRTSWGHQQPLRKCIVLSLMAHLLIAAYATTVHVMTPPSPGDGTMIRIGSIEGVGGMPAPRAGLPDGSPWVEERQPTESDAPDFLAEVAAIDAAVEEQAAVEKMLAAQPAPLVEPVEAAKETEPAPSETSAKPEPPEKIAETSPPAPDSTPPAPTETNVAAAAGPATTTSSSGAATGPTIAAAASATAAAGASAVSLGKPHVTPEMYRQRFRADRLGLVESMGGSAKTEASVVAALAWLSTHQSADGRWDADQHGAGRETRTRGQDRQSAGAKADTGLTGLALLAMLGAGHTHQTGAHAEVVRRGLDFLIASQKPDGNLAGDAEFYAFMYCHGMATLAIAEAYAMTGDPRFERPLRRALGYTLAAQNLTSGGWRYQSRQEGDTSLLGWQLMSLKSAQLGGIAMPERTRQGMVRFLNSVSSGERGGLASYLRGERPSRPMTAEALVCRQFLDLPVNGLGTEAGDFLMGDLPGQGPANFYYWYYGTLATFQLQGEHWRRWNDAVSNALTRTQRSDGDSTGSWDPDEVWGGYGGRVFSTSLGALCLEVYYRYLPLYTQTAGRERRAQ
ncbi:MAG TPA: squalene--hopene cyclase [Pirellulales bacterium]|jgi:outer membrane biosynthesis protein TonB